MKVSERSRVLARKLEFLRSLRPIRGHPETHDGGVDMGFETASTVGRQDVPGAARDPVALCFSYPLFSRLLPFSWS